jgi:hypothetical protein
MAQFLKCFKLSGLHLSMVPNLNLLSVGDGIVRIVGELDEQSTF